MLLVIKQMRWKAICFNQGKGRKDQTEWYGVGSTKCPGKVDELVPFKKGLIALEKNSKFRNVKNHFQKNLQQDIKMIRISDKTMTLAYKTNNMYRLSKHQYNMLFKNSITSTFKKSNSNTE